MSYLSHYTLSLKPDGQNIYDFTWGGINSQIQSKKNALKPITKTQSSIAGDTSKMRLQGGKGSPFVLAFRSRYR